MLQVHACVKTLPHKSNDGLCCTVTTEAESGAEAAAGLSSQVALAV